MSHIVDNDILIPEIRAILLEGRDVRFTPSGVSMRPFIEGGKDAVILRHMPSVRVGDICLCDLGTRYVLHRVIAVTPAPSSLTAHPSSTTTTPSSITAHPSLITLQGDGILLTTEQCLASDVIGTVIRIENPRGRRKPLTRGRLWYYLRPLRRYLLKIYRHVIKL